MDVYELLLRHCGEKFLEFHNTHWLDRYERVAHLVYLPEMSACVLRCMRIFFNYTTQTVSVPSLHKQHHYFA